MEGLTRKPWVKTTLAPGSKRSSRTTEGRRAQEDLDKLGFDLVGYGCTTCIGNSGPCPTRLRRRCAARTAAVSVLSGNRNFEGRINPDVKMNYLASPPLVVAYAIAGRMDVDLINDPLGVGTDGKPVLPARHLAVGGGDRARSSPQHPAGDVHPALRGRVRRGRPMEDAGDAGRGHVRLGSGVDLRPQTPYFDGMAREPGPVTDIAGARVLALLGDSVTTDHISPGCHQGRQPGRRIPAEHGVAAKDFNSYGSRRGNHEVMIRGTFANIRLRNQLVPGVEGGFTRDFTVADARRRRSTTPPSYAAAGVPLVVLAGRVRLRIVAGLGRQGTALLGVRAVIAESFERIHRSNLIGMGVVPLQFPAGQDSASLGLDGTETFDIAGITALNDGKTPSTLRVTATAADGSVTEFDAVVRIDTRGGRLLPQRRHPAVRPAVAARLGR